MGKDMKKLEEYIKNHERAVYEKKEKDNTFWGRVVLKLEFLNSEIVGFACFILISIISTILMAIGYIDLGFSIFIVGNLFVLFISSLLDVLFFRHNEMDKKEKIHTLKTIKNLAEIEKYKSQAIELSEIIDKPLSRKWWNGVVRLIDKVIKKDEIENDGGKERLIDIIKNNNYHNEKMKAEESIVLRKETVFEDRI